MKWKFWRRETKPESEVIHDPMIVMRLLPNGVVATNVSWTVQENMDALASDIGLWIDVINKGSLLNEFKKAVIRYGQVSNSAETAQKILANINSLEENLDELVVSPFEALSINDSSENNS